MLPDGEPSGDSASQLLVRRVISGGQTGADQAGLEAAERLGLLETTTSAYPERTERNVLLAAGTVVFAAGNSSGSRLTVRLCRQHGRPCCELSPDLPAEAAAERLRGWPVAERIGMLNEARLDVDRHPVHGKSLNQARALDAARPRASWRAWLLSSGNFPPADGLELGPSRQETVPAPRKKLRT